MPEASPPLRNALRFVARQGWLILLVPALALATAAFVVGQQHKVYRASMGIVVGQNGGPNVVPIQSQALNQTLTSILESDVVARAVVRDLHLTISPSDLQKKLRVQQRPDGSVLDVSYDSTRPRTALRTLSGFETAFQDIARQNPVVSRLNIVASAFDPPHLNSDPVSPRPARVLGFAGALGLALGLILAFARDSLDDRVRGPHEAEEWFGAPVLGTIPRGFGTGQSRGRERGRRGADRALELLTANLQLGSHRLGPTVLVTSALDDKSAPAMVAGLGAALARAGQEVVCVETDFRRPNLQALLGQQRNGPIEVGLAGVLEGRTEVEEALCEISLMGSSTNGGGSAHGAGRLLLLPLGAPPSDATTFTRARLSELVRSLSTRANYVLFESPPLLSSPQALALASAVNGVLLVARRGRTRRDEARAVRAALDELGAHNLAVVLVDAGA